MNTYILIHTQSLDKIKRDINDMINFKSFKILINEERRISVFRPLNDVYTALHINKTKLVTFNNLTYIHTYIYLHTYIRVIINVI